MRYLADNTAADSYLHSRIELLDLQKSWEAVTCSILKYFVLLIDI